MFFYEDRIKVGIFSFNSDKADGFLHEPERLERSVLVGAGPVFFVIRDNFLLQPVLLDPVLSTPSNLLRSNKL
jgi:hypothetical protein